jgi:hypothetical protein
VDKVATQQQKAAPPSVLKPAPPLATRAPQPRAEGEGKTRKFSALGFGTAFKPRAMSEAAVFATRAATAGKTFNVKTTTKRASYLLAQQKEPVQWQPQ